MKGSPTFPTYHGPPLPEVLNPINPRHYWLLLGWTFLQPSRLRYYLHRADPNLYHERGWNALPEALQFPAFRNFILMAPILSVGLSTSLAWAASVAQGTSLDWSRLVSSMILSIAVYVVFGLVVLVGWGLVYSLALSMVVVITWGVTVGLVIGTAQGMVAIVELGAMVGLGWCIALGIAFGTARGTVLGLAVGVALSLAIGTTLATAYSVILGLVISVMFVVAFGIGGSRTPLYILECPLAWLYSRSIHNPLVQVPRHPALWDELAMWPLPGINRLLYACLATDLENGLRSVVQVAANPFQSWAAQRALSDFIAKQPDPISVLYHMVHWPALNEYMLPPAGGHQVEVWPAGHIVLLGEIGQEFVTGTGARVESSQYTIWQLTQRWRRMDTTPLSQFSALLYELISTEKDLGSENVREIKLAERFESAYEGIRQFKYGDEVADSFAAIASFLDARTIGVLAKVHQQLDWVDAITAPFLRPTVIEVIKALDDVSREIAACERATNPGQKAAALNRAAGALNELAEYVKKEVLPPERVLLVRVVELWQSIVAAEQGRLGQAALREMTPAARRSAGIVERTSGVWQRPTTPFDNPYIAGAPVYPPLLIGRRDVFNRISEVWSAKANPDSIILYGHRRMGKSSILRNLGQVAPPGSVIVYADMAGEASFVESTADLLLGLADRIHAAVRRVYPEAKLPEPNPDAYSAPPRAQFHFDRLMEQVHEALDGHTLILALDEFEAVEQAVKAGKIGIEIYQFLRTKTQEPWLTLVFGGLHTLDEMSRDYQQPFYGSYENIRVSYLTHDDAWRLITNPTSNFVLNYEPEAVERIIAETGGQPYLVQQICRDALDHLNHELFDLEAERPALIRLSDVEAAFGDDFFQRGTVYFDGIWTQASSPDQRILLRTMAQRDEPWMFTELKTATGLNPDALRRELRWAERHDILYKMESDPSVWCFYVPLLRRWIRRMR